MKQFFEIQLNGPLCLSQSNVTTGQHRTLDHVPGRVLLGLAASRCYADLGELAFDVFHSGQVRFGDALPVWSEKTWVPMPLSMHKMKQDKRGQLTNLAVEDKQPGEQYMQQRGGYICVEGDVFEYKRPEQSSTIKTAMNIGKGSTPLSGGLYNMAYLHPGTRFIFDVSADASISQAAFSQVVDALSGAARLGRARGSQFGSAEIRAVDALTCPKSNTLVPSQLDGRTTLHALLLTDMALVDQRTGQPRLVPHAGDFGLPDGWVMDPSRSFMRHHAYDRFNGYRKCFDLRRQLIQRGSVLTFTGPALSDAQSILEPMHVGVGLDRQEGLGQFIWCGQWFEQPLLQPSAVSAVRADVTCPDDLLMAFAQSRQPILTAQELESIQEELNRVQRQIHNIQWPSKSQWSRLRQWALTTETFSVEALGELVGGTSGKLSRGWERSYPGHEYERIADWVVRLGTQHGGIYLSELAHQMRARLETGGQR